MIEKNLQKDCSRSLRNVPAIKSRYSWRTSVFHSVSQSTLLALQVAASEHI